MNCTDFALWRLNISLPFLEGLSLRLGAFMAEALSEQFLRFLAEAFIEAE